MVRWAGMWTSAGFTPEVVGTTVRLLLFEHSSDGPGCKADPTAASVAVKIPGIYVGYCFVSFIGETGVTYFFEFRVNGVPGSGFRACATGVTNYAVNASFMGGSMLHEGDTVTIHVYADAESAITLVDGQFGIMSL